MGPSAGADGKALSSVGDPGPASPRRVFFFFFCHSCLTSPPSNLTFPSWAFCPTWGTPSGQTHTLGSKLGHQGPRGPAQGLMRRHFLPRGPRLCFSATFLFLFLFFSLFPRCLTFPSWAFCPPWGTPSGPEAHPGFEPGTLGSPGPSAGANGKALSSVGDPGPTSGRRSFLIFFSAPGVSPFPHGPSVCLGVPLAGRGARWARARDTRVPGAQRKR